jgi:hypothetical protein
MRRTSKVGIKLITVMMTVTITPHSANGEMVILDFFGDIVPPASNQARSPIPLTLTIIIPIPIGVGEIGNGRGMRKTSTTKSRVDI